MDTRGIQNSELSAVVASIDLSFAAASRLQAKFDPELHAQAIELIEVCLAAMKDAKSNASPDGSTVIDQTSIVASFKELRALMRKFDN